MNLDIIYFFLYLISAIFFLVSIVYLAKYKRFQDSRTLNGSDSYLFGLVFLVLYLLINGLSYGSSIIKMIIPGYFNTFSTYLNYLVLISNLFFILMISVCFLISVILLKEANIH